MIKQRPAIATGTMFDDEGFRIATSMETAVAHGGEWAAIVLPGMAHATSVSVRAVNVRGFIHFEVSRDGKGDNLMVCLDTFMTQLVTYVSDGSFAGGLMFHEDGVTGLIYEQNNWKCHHEFTSQLHALVVAAGMFLV